MEIKVKMQPKPRKYSVHVHGHVLRQITTVRFAKFLDFLLDVTTILKELSESFQRDDLFATDIARKLDTAIANLEL